MHRRLMIRISIRFQTCMHLTTNFHIEMPFQNFPMQSSRPWRNQAPAQKAGIATVTTRR